MKLFVLIVALIAAVSAAPAEITPTYAFGEGRIIGGVDALPGEFPYQCSMQWVFLASSSHICGCSILTNNWVLTAAHCITESPDVGRYEVLAGITNFNIITAHTQRIPVASYIVYEAFTGTTIQPNDIALLRLSVPLTYNEHIQPIALPARDSIPLGPATLSGWGSTSTGAIPSNPANLQMVIKPIISYDECREAVGDTSPFYVTNICTGPLTGGVSACSGDSGGPLVQTIDGQLTQVGIVSWGFTPCGSVNAPSIHTRVSHFIDWLNENMT